jgi:hypothetical protein
VSGRRPKPTKARLAGRPVAIDRARPIGPRCRTSDLSAGTKRGHACHDGPWSVDVLRLAMNAAVHAHTNEFRRTARMDTLTEVYPGLPGSCLFLDIARQIVDV